MPLRVPGLDGQTEKWVMIQLGSGQLGRLFYADARLVGAAPSTRARALRASALDAFGAAEVPPSAFEFLPADSTILVDGVIERVPAAGAAEESEDEDEELLPMSAADFVRAGPVNSEQVPVSREWLTTAVDGKMPASELQVSPQYAMCVLLLTLMLIGSRSDAHCVLVRTARCEPANAAAADTGICFLYAWTAVADCSG